MVDKIKILIAEDDKITQKIYDNGLPDDVFEKRMVSNGADTLKTYLDWHSDILILDIRMPVMTGYAVLKKIRTEHEDRKTAIIMVTALREKDDIMACAKLGIQGYIVKPIKTHNIASKVLEYYQRIDPERAEKAREEMEKVKKEKIARIQKERIEAEKREAKIAEKKEEKTEESKEEKEKATEQKEDKTESKEEKEKKERALDERKKADTTN